MGKIRKIHSSRVGIKIPLEDEINNSKFVKPKGRTKTRLKKEEDEEYVDSNLSSKILSAARRQLQELDDDYPTLEEANPRRRPVTLGEPSGSVDDEDDDDDDEEEDLETDTFYDNIEIKEEDEEAMEMFMNKNPAPRRTLADIIMEKIQEKEAELQSKMTDVNSIEIQDIDPRVKQMYEGVRQVLHKYRSGKLPKVFKIVPKLRNWEQILFILDPPKWSAAAMYQATRIFASNLKEKMAQRFYNLVLLPRVRDDMAEYKRLNFHLYQALRKALYKPGSFMKGFLLPLLESGTCTLREAIIIGSVISQNSIPMLHSSATLLKIAEMDYTSANSIFLRIFIDKKYALPYRVVDALVFHFLRFQNDHRELPVLWHQAFLTFVQRYKADISTEQKEALLELLRTQSHPQITSEIRRELQSAKCRDAEVQEMETSSF
ncbi:hypothetical protein PPYR_10781 [Photinus pyralis]|uniref:Bystin n=1 Tax=Photinus pyralis TaxID=7054 RepID=A0A5N4AH83_PHOPY|nr:bystin [Photinus pyralis]KAB0796720.1 hypothetical protein PPYR_10781 [Photinus pyralis]